jgi:gamma-glutamylcyclotransferase (GGCT)/AIG2-like uncharacterized protein YtfP
MNTQLFAYGTLMCGSILEEIIQCSLTGCPGLLSGYCRRLLRDKAYPGIVPNKGEKVQGIVYGNVSAAAWTQLDDFEGEMYVRSMVPVELDNGLMVKAFTYILKPQYAHLLTDAGWDYSLFLKNKKNLRKNWSAIIREK